MKQQLLRLFLCALIILHAASASGQAEEKVTLTVIVIRHGEKSNVTDSLSCDSTGLEGDNLSCRGLSRALQLPAVLSGKFDIPSHVYVPTLSKGKHTGESRMFQKVTPFAVRYNLNINSSYKKDDSVGAAKDILSHKGTVLVVWEHGNIPGLVRKLGVKDPIPQWPCTDFDSIWIVTVGKKTKLKMDHEGITTSPDCNSLGKH